MTAADGAERSQTLASTVGFIFRHPANRKRRLRAVLTFAAWQVWKRTTGRPITFRYWRGLKLRIHPDSRSAGLALYTGLPEYDDMLFTARFLKPGDLMIDVGANVGLYSLLAAAEVADGRVIALEPHPLAAQRLRENVALNRLDNVDVQAAAVGAKAGIARLTADLDTTNYIVLEGNQRNSIDVPMVALDDVVAAGRTVALVKVDAEGFESAVVAGAARMLRERSVIAWIVEVNGLGQRYGSADETLLDAFRAAGYRAFRYRADGNVLEDGALPEGEAEWNLIFARDESEVRERLRLSSR